MRQLLAALAVVVGLWLLFRRDAAAAQTDDGGTGESTATFAPGTTDFTAATRARWAKALGVSLDALPALDALEDEAYAAGAPDDWAAIGWPTPCGPDDEPRRYCSAGFSTMGLPSWLQKLTN